MAPALGRFAEGGAAFAAILIAAIVVLALLIWILRRRNSPDEKERRRRLRVHRHGRLVSGVVMDIDEPEAAEGEQPRRLIHYTYRIGAVDYSACQDVTALPELMAVDPAHIVGAVQVKVHQKNLYNSIVVCEEWSGFRGRPAFDAASRIQ
ncbi:MAG: hypothetical protein GC160_08960 [Acidobacteria bacterium]|nr:hypothetical protein [Acidobacteriota bacterium]